MERIEAVFKMLHLNMEKVCSSESGLWTGTLVICSCEVNPIKSASQ